MQKTNAFLLGESRPMKEQKRTELTLAKETTKATIRNQDTKENLTI